jgi:hypothetical protein
VLCLAKDIEQILSLSSQCAYLLLRSCVDQRECFGLIQGVEAEIHVKVRPVKVIPVLKLDIQNLINGCVSEPGEVFIRQEILLVLKKKPETETIDVGHFNLQSACAKPQGCHLSFPPTFSSTPSAGFVTVYGF